MILSWIGIFYVLDSINPLPLPNAVIAAKATTSTSDPRVLGLICHWLETCMSSSKHEFCSKQLRLPVEYPTRLIDVSPDAQDGDCWKLVEVGAGFEAGYYLTLSHRWGAHTVKLDRNSHQDMMRGTPVSVLPRTYQDAIKVTRHLKQRYLWIDSICNVHLHSAFSPTDGEN